MMTQIYYYITILKYSLILYLFLKGFHGRVNITFPKILTNIITKIITIIDIKFKQ